MSASAYAGADRGRLFGDWQPWLWEVNDELIADGDALAARAWDLFRNDTYSRAMVMTLVGHIVGPMGLPWRSTYQSDDSEDTSESELIDRRSLENYVRRATKGIRFDAGGMMSWRQMTAAMLICRIVAGDAFAVRCFKPGRPDAYRGTCWRLIDPARVCNPNDGIDTERLVRGIELDFDGVPIAIHVRSSHPAIRRASAAATWQRIPFYSATNRRNVIHFARRDRPDQIRGVSEFASNIRHLKYLADVTWYWVVAKKLQASNCIIVECAAPAAAAAKDRNGALLNGTHGIKPGMKYYVETGTKVHLVNANFQGADYKDFRNANFESACAPWGLPYELVLHSLTGANLSAARAAIEQFHLTTDRWRADLSECVLQPWVESIILDGLEMGDISPQNPDPERVSEGRFVPPPKISPDRLKDANAAKAWVELGRSFASVYGEAGYAFEPEIAQRRLDERLMESQGIAIYDPSAPQAPPPPFDDPNADPNADPTTDDEPADPTDNMPTDDTTTAPAADLSRHPVNSTGQAIDTTNSPIR